MSILCYCLLSQRNKYIKINYLDLTEGLLTTCTAVKCVLFGIRRICAYWGPTIDIHILEGGDLSPERKSVKIKVRYIERK